MVSSSKISIPLQIHQLVGEKLEPSNSHLLPSIEVSQFVNMDDRMFPLIIIRGAYMTLSTRLHTLEAILSSMTPRALKLVQVKS